MKHNIVMKLICTEITYIAQVKSILSGSPIIFPNRGNASFYTQYNLHVKENTINQFRKQLKRI